jgi:hypothetical protein
MTTPRLVLCAKWGTANGNGAGYLPEADRLERLLERAAVLAAKTCSPASAGIRQAIEAMKQAEMRNHAGDAR